MNLALCVLMLMPMQNDGAQSVIPQDGDIPPYQFSLRLAPSYDGSSWGYSAGFDLEMNTLRIAPGWSTRLDAEVFWQPKGNAVFENVNSLFGVTIDQIYSFNRTRTQRWYIGGGIGGYAVPIPIGDLYDIAVGNISSYSEDVRFGGKLFFGSQFTRYTSLELGMNMVQSSKPLYTLHARVTF